MTPVKVQKRLCQGCFWTATGAMGLFICPALLCFPDGGTKDVAGPFCYGGNECKSAAVSQSCVGHKISDLQVQSGQWSSILTQMSTC